MPTALTYPGVYIEELPSGTRTITGVSTSVTAFIGRALKGPVDEPVTINSFADFERTFGGLTLESKLGFAVRNFYANGGSQAVIVRSFKPERARILLNTDQTGKQIILEAAMVGRVGNGIKVSVAHLIDPADGFNLVITADGFPTETINDLTIANLENKLLQDSSLLRVAVNGIPTGITRPAEVTDAPVASNDQVKDARAKLELMTETANDNLILEAANEGTWGNNLSVTVNHQVSADVAAALGVPATDLFNLIITDKATKTTETFVNLTVSASARRVDNILEQQSDLARVARLSGERPKLDVTTGIQAVEVKETDKASNGLVLDANTIIGSELEKTGIYALLKANIVNLLCIPPYNDVGDVAVDVINKAIEYCQAHRIFYLIDAPSAWNNKTRAVGGIKDSANPVGPISENAAIFFPHLKEANPLRNNQIETFVPCGAVAGVMARIDAERGIWKAAAGTEATLNGPAGLSVNLTDAENGELNPLGVNCLRVMPGIGSIIWGARTRKGSDLLASEWKYIPVRRLALYIEESLYRGMQWVVFEPNDEPLWRQINLNVDAFMNRLFRQGAFQGNTAKDAYFVKCDKETTTQSDIDAGVVNIVVGFAPLKPAEFVVIKLQQMTGQSQA